MFKSEDDIQFDVTVQTEHRADVYLSCSWQEDAGRDAPWEIVRELDEAHIRAVGDVTGFPTQVESRIRRIMRTARGVVVILPFRKNNKGRTSPYIIEEIRIAASLELPIAIFFEKQIGLKLVSTSGDPRHTLNFRGESEVDSITFEHDHVFGPFDFAIDGTPLGSQVSGHLHEFIECVYRQDAATLPYAFLTTRLKGDFEQAREAVMIAIENGAGIPCVWADGQQHATNVSDIHESTRLLIKHASFVVSDLTYGPESPDYDSPSRAHEVGIADAYKREICLVAQSPRRSPYFAANHLQMFFWDNEADLHEQVALWVYKHRDRFGRRIYNDELSSRVVDHVQKNQPREFCYDSKRRYIAPNAFPLSPLESWVTAAGFGLIALSTSLLLREFIGFEETFDFASILAGIAALLFSSNISIGIRRALGRWQHLRWLVPLTGLVMLLVWALTK